MQHHGDTVKLNLSKQTRVSGAYYQDRIQEGLSMESDSHTTIREDITHRSHVCKSPKGDMNSAAARAQEQ